MTAPRRQPVWLVLVLFWTGLLGCGDERASVGNTDLRTLDEGLLLHWSFEDRNATQILDLSGNGRHGTLAGDPAFVTSDSGEAIIMDGLDDAISFAGPRDPALYGGIDGAVTVSAHVRVTDADFYNTLCVGCGPIRSLFVGASPTFGPRIQVALRDGDGGGIAYHQSSEALADDEWVRTTVIVEGGVGTRIYLDCALDTEVLDPAIELDDFGYSSVGPGSQASTWFEGAIDDFRIWDRALTQEEIGELCPSAPTPAEGLELHWTFEDRDGTQILDLSGNDRHGTLQGTPSFIAGESGDAVRLDGASDYISVAGPRSPDIYGGVDGAMTLSAHVRVSDIDRYNTLCYGCGPFRSLFVGTAPYGARLMAALFNQGGGGSTWPWSTPSLLEDTWTEVTMVVEGGVGTRMFLDCALDTDTPNPDVGLRDYGYSSVGQGAAASQWFQGDMDELRIWSRALSVEEIANLCPEPEPVDPLAQDLELHWSFEDRVGNTIEDLSGNGRTGTMVGGTFVSSPNGEAANLDGVDDRIAFVGPRDVDLYGGVMGDFSVSAQVRVWDLQRFNSLCFGCGPMQAIMLGDNSENTGNPYDLGNYAQATVAGDVYHYRVATDPILDDGQWFEVTVVVEGGVGARIYINGVLMGELVEPNTRLADFGFSAIGQSTAANRWFGGEIDELRIWSRALSPEDIAPLGEGMPFFHLGLLAKWDFQYHVGQAILDRSGNNRTSYLHGGALVPSPNGEAAQFDGVDDYLSFSDLRDPELYGGEDGAFSLSTRLRVADVDAVNTICFGCGPFSSLAIGNLGAPGRAWVRLFNQVTLGSLWPITTPAIADDTWVEVTLVVDAASGARIYLDCQLDGELDNPDIGLRDYGYSSIGEGAGDTWFEGEMEMFQIWDRALTDVEIDALCL